MPYATDWPTLDRALDHALDLPEAERADYLATLAPGLRADLERLLPVALDVAEPLLTAAQHSFGALLHDPDSTFGVGMRLGAYQLDALIGEGGMGRVFRAHRADGAYEQAVAVKVVRVSLVLAGGDVAARLRRERSVLAGLQHPGIARLLDGGETADGVPYLVTELVHGLPFDAWSAQPSVTLEARLRVLVQVARAAEHAHRRLVVHRDLKPSNVLIAEREGAAHAVILDFGIAKLLDVAEAAALTHTGARPLTPAYAAPELFEAGAPITTAVDVFGLGALLFEALTGHALAQTPRASGSLRSPSAQALQDGNAALAARLRGDLDTICLQALHPVPERRYASAGAFADDLERALSGHPVSARRESLTYVAGRFARRHRFAVAAALVALVSLVGGLAVALGALQRAEAERDRAEASATAAREATRIMQDVLTQANPEYTDGQEVTVREAFRRVLATPSTITSPLTRGEVMLALAQVRGSMGDARAADSLFGAAVADFRLAGAPPDRIALALYGQARHRVTLQGVEAALPIMLRAFRTAESPRRRAVIERDLSWLYRELGQTWQANVHAQRAYREGEKSGDQILMSLAHYEMGQNYAAAGDHAQALAAFRRARALDVRNRVMGAALNNMAIAQSISKLGRHAEAVAAVDSGVVQTRAVYPLAHVQTVTALSDQSRILLDARMPWRALRVLDTLLKAEAEAKAPIGIPPTLRTQASTLLNDLGQHAKAEAYARRALRDAEREMPPPSGRLVDARVQLARALLGQRRTREGRSELDRARAERQRLPIGALEAGHVEAVDRQIQRLQQSPSPR